ncbi:hypothetical protein OK074_0779 [Actinobacteria bacterium OK074]|nr:hypothetical protein OK074_0779 [Actinobacteria bacterium OK074]
MSGNTVNTITPSVTTTSATTLYATERPAGAASVTLGRAARELALKRGELDLAVHLGCVRTVPDDGGGGRRITREEIDRVRGEAGFPETLRARVELAGTTEAAALMHVPLSRFTRLARLGLVTPVRFYLNRYRAVVWLYLAEELREFAADKKNAALLTGRMPQGLRGQLDTGLDLRARNWRGRHLGFLLRQAEDPWARAAAPACLLDPVQVAEIVQDPYERAHLNRFMPDRVTYGAPDSPAARVAARITTADDPDEIDWLRSDLTQTLAEARRERPAPRPSRETRAPRPPVPVAAPVVPSTAPAEPLPAGATPERPRGLLGWLRRGKP